MTVTSIAWTDVTWNPVRGCSRISEGCRNCYAEKIAARFSGQWALPPLPPPPGGDLEDEPRLFARMTTAGARWTGRVELIPEKLDEPLRWKKPRRVFVNSMSDLFHEDLTADALRQVWDVMRRCPRHTFQILTKRAAGMRDTFDWVLSDDPLPNVWLGVSCEDQKTADERIPLLLSTPAAVRFVSLEPLLGPIDLGKFVVDPEEDHCACCSDSDHCPCRNCQEGKASWLDWVICGGESGPGPRPCDFQWIRDIVRQCKAAGVPVFVKQLGANVQARDPIDPIDQFPNDAIPRFSQGPDKATALIHLRDRKGGDPSEWPEDIRVREFPGGHP